MRDVELYGTILGRTPPWMVAKVDLDVQVRQVVVHVEARRRTSTSSYRQRGQSTRRARRVCTATTGVLAFPR